MSKARHLKFGEKTYTDDY